MSWFQTNRVASQNFPAFEREVMSLVAAERLDEAAEQLDAALEQGGNPHQAGIPGAQPWSEEELSSLMILRAELALKEQQPVLAENILSHLLLSNEDTPELEEEQGIRALQTLADALEWQGKNAQAIQAWEALDQETQNKPVWAHARVMALAGLGRLLQQDGEFGKAESHLIEAIELVQDELGEGDSLLLNLLESVGTMYWHAGHPEQAQQVYVDALALIDGTEVSEQESFERENLLEDRTILEGYLASVLYLNGHVDESCQRFDTVLNQLQQLEMPQQKESIGFILERAGEVFAYARLPQQQQLAQQMLAHLSAA